MMVNIRLNINYKTVFRKMKMKDSLVQIKIFHLKETKIFKLTKWVKVKHNKLLNFLKVTQTNKLKFQLIQWSQSIFMDKNYKNNNI
jgi:hypothetical protein